MRHSMDRTPLLLVRALGLLSLLLILSSFESAQADAGVRRALAISEQVQAPAPTQGESGPVLVPEPSDKALRYYRSGNVIWILNVLWGLVVPAIILFSGFSARIRDRARKMGRKWFFVIGVYSAVYLLLNYILDFPLDYYEGFHREHAYGLSNQSFGQWLGDSLKALMVTLLMAGLLLWIPYLLLKKSPRRWWLYTSMAAVPVLFVILLVLPIWIAPLFDDFGPMSNKALETEILQLAERAGIEQARVFEVSKSEDTEKVNAYVTGIWNTQRIVLWDTLTQKLDGHQVLFVMGHEMGHYVLNHLWKSIVVISALLLVALYGVHRTGSYLILRFRHRFGFDQLSDIASLPLLMLLISLFSLVLQPLAWWFSRHVEHESDQFGLEITKNNTAAASAFVTLQYENLVNPRPGLLYVLWRGSHPTLVERVDFANTYQPWKTGEKLQYEDRFRTKE